MRRKRFAAFIAISLVLGVTSAAPARSRVAVAPVAGMFGPARGVGGVGRPTGSRYGYLPLHPEGYASAKALADARAASAPAPVDPVTSPATPSNVSPSWNGVFQAGVTPPDANGAVGTTRYVETVNTKFAIYDRSGGLLRSGSLAKLTGISGHALSDPEVKFDVATGRFYYSAVYYDPVFLSDNGLAIGFSKTSSPNGPRAFCKYHLSTGSDLPDYPKLGDTGGSILVGYNQFSTFATTYDGSQVFWLSKPPAGSGCPAASTFHYGFSGILHNADVGSTLMSTPVPADLIDTTSGTGYVVGAPDLTTAPYTSGASFLTVVAVTTGAGGVVQFGAPVSVPVPSYALPPNAPQQGTTAKLDTLDGRLESAAAAVDPGHGGIAIWTAHAVASADGLRSEERWYEIDPSTGSLFGSGAASDSSLFVWNGAIAPDRNGATGSYGQDMAMSVNTSSTGSYPAIRFVWKTGSDPQSPLTLLVASAGFDQDSSCSPCRWGDYSGASADPASTGPVGKVWLTNQYNLASATTSDTDWRTWNFAVTPT